MTPLPPFDPSLNHERYAIADRAPRTGHASADPASVHSKPPEHVQRGGVGNSTSVVCPHGNLRRCHDPACHRRYARLLTKAAQAPQRLTSAERLALLPEDRTNIAEKYQEAIDRIDDRLRQSRITRASSLRASSELGVCGGDRIASNSPDDQNSSD